MSRAQRRADNERVKAKFSHIAKHVLHDRALALDKKWVGQTAAVHLTCDCAQCKYPGSRHHHPGFEARNPTELYQ
jgi:hypothetical protein